MEPTLVIRINQSRPDRQQEREQEREKEMQLDRQTDRRPEWMQISPGTAKIR